MDTKCIILGSIRHGQWFVLATMRLQQQNLRAQLKDNIGTGTLIIIYNFGFLILELYFYFKCSYLELFIVLLWYLFLLQIIYVYIFALQRRMTSKEVKMCVKLKINKIGQIEKSNISSYKKSKMSRNSSIVA